MRAICQNLAFIYLQLFEDLTFLKACVMGFSPFQCVIWETFQNSSSWVCQRFPLMLLMASSRTNPPLVTAVLIYFATVMLSLPSICIVSSSKERICHMSRFLKKLKGGTDFFMPYFSPSLPDSCAYAYVCG